MILSRKRKGSSSILVILCFLMLGIFSILAMTTTFADYRLAQKNASWTKEYYILEGQAQEFIYRADKALEDNLENNLDKIKDSIIGYDINSKIIYTEEGMLLSRIFESESGKSVLVELELLDRNEDRFKLRTLKEIPKEFEYENDIQFEDVEVIGQ